MSTDYVGAPSAAGDFILRDVTVVDGLDERDQDGTAVLEFGDARVHVAKLVAQVAQDTRMRVGKGRALDTGQDLVDQVRGWASLEKARDVRRIGYGAMRLAGGPDSPRGAEAPIWLTSAAMTSPAR